MIGFDYNDVYFDLINCKKRYLVLCGGSNSGKSVFVAQKLLIRIAQAQKKGRRHGFLCLRQSGTYARVSIFQLFLELVRDYEIPCKINETNMKITFPGGSFILCKGLDEIQKLKSIVGITGIWLEEAIEFTKDEFLELDRRVRGVANTYVQIILSFNPNVYIHWIRDLFFSGENEYNNDRASQVLTTTIDDNKFANKEDFEALNRLEVEDYGLYQVYRKGLWTVLKGLIYSNYDIVDSFPQFSDVIYGHDFEYSTPVASLKIGIYENEYYLQELIYKTNLTSAQWVAELDKLDIDKYACHYGDSSRPDYIDEAFNAGYNIRGADKPAGSVITGIDIVKKCRLHILKTSHNMIKEIRGYKFKQDRDGNVIDDPVKRDDHLCDALRYSLYMYMQHSQPKVYLV
jgi:phage terminase large subunit